MYGLIFDRPFFFIGGLLLGISILVWRRIKHRATAVKFQFSSFFARSSITTVLLRTKRLLYLLIVVGCSIILAHPKRVHRTTTATKKGIDIVLTLDISYSMEANDFQPNRLEAAKVALTNFLHSRSSDRIGLVVFAGKPFISLPLTFDYSIFEEILKNTTTATIDQGYQQLQGTAVGDALLSSITLLEKGKEEKDIAQDREQIIVLFTDGAANVGIDPEVVAELAREKHIAIYTVGIGSLEGGFITMQTPFGTRQQAVGGVDEAMLQHIAERTQGSYARAVSSDSLEDIITAISALKTSEVTDETHTQLRDASAFFLAAMSVILGVLLRLEKKTPVL